MKRGLEGLAETGDAMNWLLGTALLFLACSRSLCARLLAQARSSTKSSQNRFAVLQVHRALVILEPVETDVESLKALLSLDLNRSNTDGETFMRPYTVRVASWPPEPEESGPASGKTKENVFTSNPNVEGVMVRRMIDAWFAPQSFKTFEVGVQGTP